jgi:hypothetical protein
VRLYRTECKLVLFNHVKARLLGERDAATSLACRLGAELMSKKPLWVRIEYLMRSNCTFEAIWRASNKPQHIVAEALGGMLRIGMIDRLPDGMPFPRPVKPVADLVDVALAMEA